MCILKFTIINKYFYIIRYNLITYKIGEKLKENNPNSLIFIVSIYIKSHNFNDSFY